MVERNDAGSNDALSQQQDHEPQTKAVQITLQSADASHKKRSRLQLIILICHRCDHLCAAEFYRNKNI